MYIFALLCIPILIPLFALFFLHRTLKPSEIALQVLMLVVLVCGGWFGGISSQTSDTELLNGQITKKYYDDGPCSHSYSCPPCYTTTSGTGANKTTTRHCSTCYRHSFDRDWYASSTVGRFHFPTIDSQGLMTPARWSAVQLLEPVSIEHSYVNYVKAADLSLFNRQKAEHEGVALPPYPEVYDRYRVKRVIDFGAGLPASFTDDLNTRLNNALRSLGGKKQVNIVVLFVPGDLRRIADALDDAWLGGKKNDVVVVIEWSKAEQKIAGVKAFGWSQQSLVFTKIQDDIFFMEKPTSETVADAITGNVEKYFSRLEMRNFEYLKDSITPPTWWVFTLLIGGILASIGLTVFFHRNDL